MPNDIMYPVRRKAMFREALTKALLSVETERIRALMQGVDWKWYTQGVDPAVPTESEIRDFLHRILDWGDNIDFDIQANFAQEYSGGFFIASHEYPADEDGPACIRVSIVFGLCVDGEVENA